MLVTKQPVFRRFWYPVIPMDQLVAGPKPFELLGEPIVIWLGSDGTPQALRDRCPHRTAKLSLGSVKDGHIQCPYHGWNFDGQGICKKVPQLASDRPIPDKYKATPYLCQERYGYAWVCLSDAPLADIPDIPEASDPNFRLIPEFYEPWHCAGLRIMENECDMAHPTFVHTTTFGSSDHPTPEQLEITETDFGLEIKSVLGVANNPLQKENLKMEAEGTVRTLDVSWYLPFTVRLKIAYPNGLIHIIVNTATPVQDGVSQIVQFCLRNDTEAETPASKLIAFDRAVTLEDKAILETTDYDIPLDLSQEQHMMTDKPGMLMRHRIASLLREHGEIEQTKASGAQV